MDTKQWDRLAQAACKREMAFAAALRAGGASWEEVLDALSPPAMAEPLDGPSSAELYGRLRAYMLCVREQRRTLA